MRGEKVYKVFVIEDGVLKNLFRGIEGSRKVITDEWLRAENKWSVDGSGQDEYLTGIHVLKEREKAEKYLEHFRSEKDRVIVECYAEDMRVKQTNENVYLADWLYVPQESMDEVLNNCLTL